jgi:protein phosphatase
MLVVADGMGGQGGGDVASNVAVSAVARYLLDVMPWTPFAPHTIAPQASLPGVRDRLSSALVAGDSRIKNLAAATATPHMGSTLTVALVLWPLLYVAHVGDTRCYLLRSGNLRQLTTDHTMAQVMAQAEAEPVASGSHLHHILWNALGGNDDVPKPEITRVALELGDVLLLCSDGLTKHVTDAQIAAVLAVDESTAVRCRKLVELANLNGGSDNVTVIVAVPNTAMTAPTGTTAG